MKITKDLLRTIIKEQLDEMCGSPHIVKAVHHQKPDHEGKMAKRQMFKTAEYAAEIFDMLDVTPETPQG